MWPDYGFGGAGESALAIDARGYVAAAGIAVVGRAAIEKRSELLLHLYGGRLLLGVAEGLA